MKTLLRKVAIVLTAVTIGAVVAPVIASTPASAGGNCVDTTRYTSRPNWASGVGGPYTILNFQLKSYATVVFIGRDAHCFFYYLESVWTSNGGWISLINSMNLRTWVCGTPQQSNPGAVVHVDNLSGYSVYSERWPPTGSTDYGTFCGAQADTGPQADTYWGASFESYDTQWFLPYLNI